MMVETEMKISTPVRFRFRTEGRMFVHIDTLESQFLPIADEDPLVVKKNYVVVL